MGWENREWGAFPLKKWESNKNEQHGVDSSRILEYQGTGECKIKRTKSDRILPFPHY